MKKWFVFLLALGASFAYAESAEHGEGPVEVPKVVLYQAINVAILFGGLFYFLKDKVIKFYQDRQATYTAAAEKSKAAREQAERQFVDIKHKIEQLENSADESISRARAEAVDMKHAMVKEAQEMSLRIKHEAEETAKIEILKAQTHLREQLLREAIDAAKAVLSKDIGSADHQKLQSDFVNNVQAVNP
jgi:F-type H+-transporting ATPase subunit b